MITYLPWVNNNEGKPWLYVGSTVRDLNIYFGTVAHKTYKEFWVKEQKANPENFKKEILFHCMHEDREILLSVEHNLQVELDVVKDERYFNRSYANSRGCFGLSMVGTKNPNYGKKKSKEWKENHSKIMSEIHGRDENRQNSRILQKEIQNREEVANKKSVGQKQAWKELKGNLANCKKTQWKPIRKHLKDFSFLSSGALNQFCEDNNIRKFLINTIQENDDFSLSDFILLNDITNIFNQVKMVNIGEALEILEAHKSVGFNYRKIELDLNKKYKYHNIISVINRFNCQYDELKNLESRILQSGNGFLQTRFLERKI